MLEVMISWIYMGLLCATVGYGLWKMLARIGVAGKSSPVKIIMTGIVAITVYTEYISVLYKIALLAQMILLIPVFLILIHYRGETISGLKKYAQKLFTWEGFFFVMLALFFAFYTSRGTFHTDTNIYHAANIRIYEEVGLIKGMANLQWNFGYNSASLAFASFFSMGWLLPHPIHTTTGFLELVLAGYTCHHLKDWKKHTSHLGDASCIAIWVYFWDMITYSMSPATDYAAMMLALYGITAWILAMENGEDVSAYALISVFMVYVLTIKVSAGCLVLLAIYPGIKLLSDRQFRKTFIYFTMGVIVLLPYLIRNYLISGWLIYPFAGIDLFQVDWKVPLAVLQRDAGQIEAYGKCLYKPELADTPIRQWIPVWWAGQRFDERMLIMVFGFGTIGFLVHAGMELLHHKFKPQWLILIFAIGCSALLWFMQAPFIRYGLSFLLEMPLLLGGICISGNRHGFK